VVGQLWQAEHTMGMAEPMVACCVQLIDCRQALCACVCLYLGCMDVIGMD
jgi:hypothetical protein